MRCRSSFIKVLLCLVLLFFAACAGSSSDGGTEEGGVGTIVSNPTPPKTLTNIFPDFSEHWNEENIVGFKSERTSTATEIFTGEGKQTSPKTDAGTGRHIGNFQQFWYELIVNTGFDALVEGMEETYRMGEEVTSAINAAGLVPSDIMQSVSVDTHWVWINDELSRVDFIKEAGTEDYLRFYFVTDVILATYLVRMDENGEPVRGMLVFVSPQLLRTTLDDRSIPPTFLVEVVFDYTGEKDITVVRMNRRNGGKEYIYYSFDIRSQCGEVDSDDSECTVSFIQAQKDINIVDARINLGMRRADGLTCFQGSFLSSTGAVTFNEPALINPDQPPEKILPEFETCTIQDAPWLKHVFLREDLPNADGATALAYILDGTARDGWLTVTPARISEIIDPQ